MFLIQQNIGHWAYSHSFRGSGFVLEELIESKIQEVQFLRRPIQDSISLRFRIYSFVHLVTCREKSKVQNMSAPESGTVK